MSTLHVQAAQSKKNILDLYLLYLLYVPGCKKELEEEEYGFLLRSHEYGLASCPLFCAAYAMKAPYYGDFYNNKKSTRGPGTFTTVIIAYY